MRIRLPLGRTLFFVCAFLLALIALIPMRLGLDWLDFGERGFAAREAEGSIWNGALSEAQLAAASLGDLRAGLGFFPLVLGRARIDLARDAGDGAAGEADMFEGAISVSRRSFGFDDMRAHLLTADVFAPLPLRSIDLDDVSARFEDGLCVAGEGLVRAEMSGDIGGIPLPATLSGNARCDGGALLLPLLSQSGMEQINLRLDGGGEYALELVMNPSDDAARLRLAASGFAPTGQGYALTVQGSF